MPPGGPRGHGPHGSHGSRHGDEHLGAQTFRLGRALDFLQRLDVHRATLKSQLEQAELKAIHSVLTGELKAIELVRNEFIDAFGLGSPQRHRGGHRRTIVPPPGERPAAPASEHDAPDGDAEAGPNGED